MGAAYITTQLLFEFTAYVLTCDTVAERSKLRCENVVYSETQRMYEKAEKTKYLL